MNKFELMPTDWYKRRPPVTNPVEVVNVTVNGFEKCDNKYCAMIVDLSNNTTVKLDARISVSEVYTLVSGKLTVEQSRWTVHGINNEGLSVLVKLSE